MHLNKIEDAVAWLLGLISGGIAYANIPSLLHIDWSFLISKLVALLWAGGIAFFTGAMGWLGQKMMGRWKWLKRILNNKNQ